jgi:hypothetical protein
MGAQSGTQMGPRPIKELVLGHIMGSRRGHSFILGLHTTIFQPVLVLKDAIRHMKQPYVFFVTVSINIQASSPSFLETS